MRGEAGEPLGGPPRDGDRKPGSGPSPDRDEGMLGGLLRAAHLVSLEDLPALVAEHAARAGLAHAMLYVADLQQQFLVPLPGQRDEAGNPLERIPIDTTVAGLAFRGV